MTIEEKAKAYDDAKARMRKAYNDNRCSFYFMKEIFPESKESEDERIWKTLIEYFNTYPKDYYGELKKSDILSFLKKQKPINDTDDDMRLTIIQFLKYASSYGCPDILSKEKAETWIAWLEKQEKSEFEQSIQDGDNIVTNEDGTHFNMSQLERVAKKESKLAIEMKTPEESLGIDSDTYNKIMDECIYGEQKPAWSEEDEYMLNETIQHLEELIIIDKTKHCGVDVQYYQRDIDWLKSLKDRVQFQWKPSEEQIQALEYQVNSTCKDSWQYKASKELLEQLKKL